MSVQAGFLVRNRLNIKPESSESRAVLQLRSALHTASWRLWALADLIALLVCGFKHHSDDTECFLLKRPHEK